ncbi:hypothetical protein [Pseudomonas sp. zfem002]|uniref:hypothetical protein n=1 Tax=Pseudomonas sp. zfem002 TaxID=3078197 RepID=UPI0029283B97|nr:hypothetical protein [Pseudomonas sp. zfem002]MDU9391843.1 hypothetical protein [Pseudomonas sp. zfem002]
MTIISTTGFDIWIAMVLLTLVFGIPVTFVIALSHRIYITRKYLNDMMAAIKSSPDLTMTMERYASLGLSRRILIPSLLHGAVFQTRFISAGLVSRSDAENFPKHLKKTLRRDNIIQNIGIIWFLVTFLILLIRKYLN